MFRQTWFRKQIPTSALFGTTTWTLVLPTLISGLWPGAQVQGTTFTVDEINGSPGYSMDMVVTAGKFLSETTTWGLMNNRAALFHCPSTGSVSVSVNVDHLGLDSVQPTGQDGTSIRKNLAMEIDQTYRPVTHGIGLVNLTGWEEIADDDWTKIEKHSVFLVHRYKPLHVAMNKFNLSSNRLVMSHKMTPYFSTNDSGKALVEFQRANCPDVGVQVTTESRYADLRDSYQILE